MEPSDASQPEQPWEPKAVAMPKKIDQLSIVFLTMPRQWLADGMGYYGETGDFLMRDVWRVLAFDTTGRAIKTSALMTECVNALWVMLPNLTPDAAKKLNLVVVSGSGLSVLTTRGEMVGALGDPKKSPVVDVVKLETDLQYRQQFFRDHPSLVGEAVSPVFDFSPGTESGDALLKHLHKRFPHRNTLGDRQYRVNDKTGAAALGTNNASLLDRIVSHTHPHIGPFIATPYGAGLTIVNFLIGMAYAADTPLRGSMMEARFSGQDMAATLDHYLNAASQPQCQAQQPVVGK